VKPEPTSAAAAADLILPYQPAILAPVPAQARVLTFDLRVGVDPRPPLSRLRAAVAVDRTVIGLGLPLVLALGAEVPGLRPFPALCGPAIAFPSTQNALWIFLAAGDASTAHDDARAVAAALGDGFVLREEVATWKYRGGRDLSDYEDGTENPKEALAIAAAIVAKGGPGITGSSFVAGQRYVHDLERFGLMPASTRDAVIGRAHATNEELPDAPLSAHVKRAAQESYDPPAFMVRRSMPWGDLGSHGLYFVAYGESLDRFERVLGRMSGREDGVVDGLLGWSRAISGGYYWCPPVLDGRVDLRAVGL
jgi:putative iron-dependent peroxidase